MEITGRGIALRDFTLADLPARMRWEQGEIEWQRWDAPWQFEGLTAEGRAARQADLRQRLNALAKLNMSLAETAPRNGFEIYRLSPRQNIGWMNSYFLAEDCTISETATERVAVGIDIPSPECRGQGYGKAALGEFVAYLLATGRTDLYTQTWGGNKSMILLADSLGFEPHRRMPDLREVNGERYDGLTFKLNIDRFWEIWG